jgi:type 1 glutamine amidotransferase
MAYKKIIATTCFFFSFAFSASFAQRIDRFHVVVIAEKGGLHEPFVVEAESWLQQLSKDSCFSLEFIENTEKIDSAFLANCQLLIQLNYPPYMWTQIAMAAFENYIIEGRSGGWIGFHHASLLGEFDGYPMWQWFSDFMGGIRYTNYIAGFASATVKIEDESHPTMSSISTPFEISKDEWYTYNKSPRANVHVLASVDESSYKPSSEIKMGDHPVIWTNERMKARNIYIFMGHDPGLFSNISFTTLFRNSIFWAASHQ